MTLFYDKEFRLLLRICILLLKANRMEIDIKELNTICLNEFSIENVVEKLISKHLADLYIFKPVVKLLYPQEFYEEMAHEMDTNEYVQSMREDIWLPFYRQKEIEKEIKENKYDYLGLEVRDKIISGIGDKCIVLISNNEKSYHWFNLPKHILLNQEMNAEADGYEVAKEILRLHADWENNFHLAYILFDIKGHEKWFQNFNKMRI